MMIPIIPGLLPHMPSRFIATVCPWCRRPTTAEHTMTRHAERTRRFRCKHQDCRKVMIFAVGADDRMGEPVAVEGRR